MGRDLGALDCEADDRGLEIDLRPFPPNNLIGQVIAPIGTVDCRSAAVIEGAPGAGQGRSAPQPRHGLHLCALAIGHRRAPAAVTITN